ncbi:hypothetical protein HanPI659440_Chr06g0249161 [Helianthus annuus]|nr:hypothetical protein HanPI659440_Chr06g0249161 [Helianthus annuus]
MRVLIPIRPKHVSLIREGLRFTLEVSYVTFRDNPYFTLNLFYVISITMCFTFERYVHFYLGDTFCIIVVT